MQKYIVSVSKKNNSVWKSYFYILNDDGSWSFQSKRINPLLIWYYKLKKYHRTKGMCSECYREFIIFTNWHDRNKNPRDRIASVRGSVFFKLRTFF